MARVHDVDPAADRPDPQLAARPAAGRRLVGPRGPPARTTTRPSAATAGTPGWRRRRTSPGPSSPATPATPKAGPTLDLPASPPARAIDDPYIAGPGVPTPCWPLDPNGRRRGAVPRPARRLKKTSARRQARLVGAAGRRADDLLRRRDAAATSRRRPWRPWPCWPPAASPATARAALAWLVAQKDAQRHLALDPGDRAGPQGTARRRPASRSAATARGGSPSPSTAARPARWSSPPTRPTWCARSTSRPGPPGVPPTDARRRGGDGRRLSGRLLATTSPSPGAPPKDEGADGPRRRTTATTLRSASVGTATATVTNRRRDGADGAPRPADPGRIRARRATTWPSWWRTGAREVPAHAPQRRRLPARARAGPPLTLWYRLRATMPVTLAVPPALAYEYYDPARQGSSPAVRLTVERARGLGALWPRCFSLVPTVPRGNAVFDAPRRPGPATERTQSVQDGIPTQERGNEL